MNFYSPTTLNDALTLLAHEPEARCLAGGQTLGAMMNADLVRPAALVSLRRIPSLVGIEMVPTGGLVIGAMTTHNQVAASAVVRRVAPIVALAAQRIAHPAIRNAGTIGGSIAHADPAADFPVALVAADATIEIAGVRGRRTLAARDFFQGYMQTALEAGEIVAAILVPPTPPGALAHYEKLSRVDGDFAIVSVAAVLAFSRDRCTHARLVVGACAGTPIRSEEAEASLVGTTVNEAELEAAAEKLAALCDPIDDFRGSAAYRLKVMPRLLKRAVRTARETH